LPWEIFKELHGDIYFQGSFNTGFLPTEVFTPHTRSTIETHQEPFYCMLARVKIGGFEMPLHKHAFLITEVQLCTVVYKFAMGDFSKVIFIFKHFNSRRFLTNRSIHYRCLLHIQGCL